MILNIREIPEGHSEISRECELDSIKNDLPPMDGKIKCHGEINRIGADIYMHLHFEGVFLLQCSRCLEDCRSPVSGEVQFSIRELVGKHGKSDDEEEQVDFYYDSNYDQLDVSSAFYDELMIEIPLMPLCSLECKGVEVKDSDISVDLVGNKKIEDRIDPRWDALRKLKANK
jgi:uncharacterized protein